MGRFEVILGHAQGYEDGDLEAVMACKTPLEIAACYEKWLEQRQGQSVIDLPAFPLSEKVSESFGIYTEIERSILRYLRSHEDLEAVRILCPDAETRRLYMVVYNHLFATSKETRLNDGGWD